MRRHTEDAADLRHGKLLRFEELAVLWRKRDWFIGHTLFQHCHTMGIGCTAISRFPAITDTVRVFHNAGMLQHTTGCAPFLKKEEPYLSTAMEVPRLFFIMAIGEKPIRPLKPSPAHERSRPGGSRCPCSALPELHPCMRGRYSRARHFHLGQLRHFPAKADTDPAPCSCHPGRSVRSVAPEKQMGHQRFPKDKGCHLRVGLAIQNLIQRMIRAFSLFPLSSVIR